jgi:hypothetical protein
MMPLRKLLIRVMLWSLGLTAVAGAAAALVGGGDTRWRIVATGMSTALAAGFMIPFSFLADKPKTRREGLLGMTLVIVEFAGGLGLIWNIFQSLGGWKLEENVGLSMLFLAMTALPAILFLWMISKPSAHIAGIIGTGLCTAVFVMLMIATWVDSAWPRSEHWYGTAVATAWLGVLAVASLGGVGTSPGRWWRWVGVSAASGATAAAICAIWKEIHAGDGIFIVIVSVAAVVAFANLCLMVPLTASQKWVRIATILAAAATAILIDLLALGSDYQFEIPMAENLAAATGIIASCGGLALLVLARINRHLDRVPVLSEIRQITIVCPGCNRKQTATLGESSCAGCGLIFRIGVEEPRCPKCDYLLFMLKSDRCPECGEVVTSDPSTVR